MCDEWMTANPPEAPTLRCPVSSKRLERAVPFQWANRRARPIQGAEDCLTPESTPYSSALAATHVEAQRRMGHGMLTLAISIRT